jgi:hypothetical protein
MVENNASFFIWPRQRCYGSGEEAYTDNASVQMGTNEWFPGKNLSETGGKAFEIEQQMEQFHVWVDPHRIFVSTPHVELFNLKWPDF